MQVLDCAVLLTSCDELHSKQRAVRWRGLLARNDSIFCLNPPGLSLPPADEPDGSPRGAPGKPGRGLPAAAAGGAGAFGLTMAAGVMAKYWLHRRQ